MLRVTYEMIRDAAAAAKTEAEKLKNQPLMAAIIELQGFAFELQAENADLKKERDQRANLTLRENVYWSEDPKNPGPFCPACWGSGKGTVPLYTGGETDRYRHCPACKVHIPIPGMKRPEKVAPRVVPGNGWVNKWRRDF